METRSREGWEMVLLSHCLHSLLGNSGKRRGHFPCPAHNLYNFNSSMRHNFVINGKIRVAQTTLLAPIVWLLTWCNWYSITLSWSSGFLMIEIEMDIDFNYFWNQCLQWLSNKHDFSFIWMESFSLAQEQRKTTPLFFN